VLQTDSKVVDWVVEVHRARLFSQQVRADSTASLFPSFHHPPSFLNQVKANHV